MLAARKLGIADVPVMTAKGWTEAQKRAYVLADNQLALNAGWDTDLLKVELCKLDDLNFDLQLTGFSSSEIENMMFDGNFAPGTEDEQGKLDELSPMTVRCPSCEHRFNARDHAED